VEDSCGITTKDFGLQ